MNLVDHYRTARASEELARLRRLLSLRAMAASGMTQRQIADQLDISQPAVSQQLATASDLSSVHPELLVRAAAPVVKEVIEQLGFTDAAVFGSIARQEARDDSDIDLLIRQPSGTTIKNLTHLRSVLERILGRRVDVVTYGGLDPLIDQDIQREAVPL